MQIALANNENDRVIDFGVMAAQLHLRLSSDAERIMEWAKEGTIKSVDASLEMISLFEPNHQFVLHCGVLFHILFNDNIPKEQNFKNFFEEVNFTYLDRIGQDEIFYNNEYFKL